MATLNIGGRKVKVDDSFTQMTPEQQNAAVEEIAASLNISAAPQPGNVEASSPEFEDAMSSASQKSQFAGGPVTPRDQQQQPMRPDLAGATAATLAGAVEGIPVVGPFIQNASDALVGAGATLMGGDYDQTVEGLRTRRQQLQDANPIADIAGQLAGGVGAFGAASKVAGGAAALGLEGNLGQRVLNSAVSSGGISAADAMVRDGDVLQAAGIGAGVGAAIPVVGAIAGGVTRAIGNKVRPTVQSVLDPAEEASRQAGVAFRRDLASAPESVVNSTDEAVARQAGIPLTNADRGGETVRALTRSVANQSPEARGAIQKVADDRFVGQGSRATEFIRRLTGGNADDLGYQQAIKDTARKVNEPRYRAAYNDPKAAAVWTPQIRQLMQSPRFLNAIRQAESRGADKAAISGYRAVKNPFDFRTDGSIGLKVNADGSRALPSLEFWNQVKRNIDGQIDQATRGAKPDRTLVADLTQIKNILVSTLDDTVPAYGVARKGAASFFGAEDALDAGRQFANSMRAVPEAKRAFAQFSAAERKAFQTGYASELIDKITATRDRSNVVDQVFGNQSRREMIQLVFGPAKAKELEAYVRVEALADRLRGAMGNSTTARQLMELGIGGGAGFALSGDWQGALTGAALARGSRYAGEKVNARVMEHLGRLLTSQDPAALQKAVFNAAHSEEWMKALAVIEQRLGIATRSQVPQIAQAS